MGPTHLCMGVTRGAGYEAKATPGLCRRECVAAFRAAGQSPSRRLRGGLGQDVQKLGV